MPSFCPHSTNTAAYTITIKPSCNPASAMLMKMKPGLSTRTVAGSGGKKVGELRQMVQPHCGTVVCKDSWI